MTSVFDGGASPGWWEDPEGSGGMRYWDGLVWSRECRLPPNFFVMSVVEDSSDVHSLVPQAGAQPNSVDLEPGDGQNLSPFFVTGIAINEVQPKTKISRSIVSFPAIEAVGLITDSRVAIASSKFDRGSSWTPFGGIGSGVIAITATAVSKSRARSRSRGKTLVGHLRYPFLDMIVYEPAPHGRGNGSLTLWAEIVPTADSRRYVVLNLGLLPRSGQGLSVAGVALEIAKRAALARLATTPASEEVARLEEIVKTDNLNVADSKKAIYVISPIQ